MTRKQVRVVRSVFSVPVQDIAEIALFDDSGNPVDPSTLFYDYSVTTEKLADNSVTANKIARGVLPTNATKAKAGLVKQAAHVSDPAGETPTKAEFIALRNALVTAGQMASA